MSAWVRASAVSEVLARSADRFGLVLENIDKVVKIEGVRQRNKSRARVRIGKRPLNGDALGFLMAGSKARCGEAAYYAQLAFARDAACLRQLAKILQAASAKDIVARQQSGRRSAQQGGAVAPISSSPLSMTRRFPPAFPQTGASSEVALN